MKTIINLDYLLYSIEKFSDIQYSKILNKTLDYISEKNPNGRRPTSRLNRFNITADEEIDIDKLNSSKQYIKKFFLSILNDVKANKKNKFFDCIKDDRRKIALKLLERASKDDKEILIKYAFYEKNLKKTPILLSIHVDFFDILYESLNVKPDYDSLGFKDTRMSVWCDKNYKPVDYKILNIKGEF